MKTMQEAMDASSCEKRITVCEIYDFFGKLLSRDSNRCSPVGGKCHRLGVVQGEHNYDVSSECNWTHAEIMAIRSLPGGRHEPYMAVLYGHDFYCKACQQALARVGVEVMIVAKEVIA